MASTESCAPWSAQILCLCQGHQTFPDCTIFTLDHLTCMLDAWSLLPYMRLLEYVSVTLYLRHGSKVRVILGNGCFWKLLGQSATYGTPFLAAQSVLGDLPWKLYAADQVGFARYEWLLGDFGSRGYSWGLWSLTPFMHLQEIICIQGDSLIFQGPQ